MLGMRQPYTRDRLLDDSAPCSHPGTAMPIVHINISYGDEPLHQRLMMIESKSPSMS